MRPPITRSSRVGSRNYKRPKPLRFDTVQEALDLIGETGLHVTEHITTRNGATRINVVDLAGTHTVSGLPKARTISVPAPKPEKEADDAPASEDSGNA